jgi:DNA polymerase
MSLIFDFETRSAADLINRGVYIYVEHPTTDALLASFKLSKRDGEELNREEKIWAAHGGPINAICRWTNGEPMPEYLRAYVAAGGEICAHNAAFERLIWWHVMHIKHGWIKPKLKQFRCTAATAAAMALPRSLDRLGEALNLKMKKDKAGSDLIRIHSVPQGFDINGNPIWHKLCNDQASLARFHDYCDMDVLSEEEAHHRLVPLSDQEMEVYWLNETINDRGLRIDTASAHSAIELAEKTKASINAKLFHVTEGAVPSYTLTSRLKEWVHRKGVPIAALDKDEIDGVMQTTLPPEVRTALELRIEGNKSSVDKIEAMLRSTTLDGTVKGVFLHHGAGQTGRFSARIVQLHNMPRPRKIFEDAHPRLDVLFDVIRTSDPDYMQELYGKELGRPLHLLADAVRSFIWAKPGYQFIGGDFSSIEGRLAAWFGREDWKLEAFRKLDRGEGAGIYETTAASIYNIPVQAVSKPQRQVGKIAELALGFGGGAGALARMAHANRLDLSTVYPNLWEVADDDRRWKANARYEENVKRQDATALDLGREAYVAAVLIVQSWRDKHSGIASAWHSLMDAAFEATHNPNTIVPARGIPHACYLNAHGFLWLKLPSGRCLAYGLPEVREVEVPWADKTQEVSKRERQPAVTVRGVGNNNQWMRYPLNISICYNNLVQGTARDLLCHAMFQVERGGYPVVLHCHDEIMAEVPKAHGSVEEFENLMCKAPKWAADLPLSAAGFMLKRYAKA